MKTQTQQPQPKRAKPKRKNLLRGKKSNNPTNGKKKKRSKNRELAIVSYIFVCLFLSLIGYFTYFNIVKAQEIIESPYNTRDELYASQTKRGDILSSDGSILATTETYEDGTESRTYPYGSMFAHVIGYAYDTMGKTGMESINNQKLITSNISTIDKFFNDFKNEKDQGDSIVTTLNVDLQRAAYEALEAYEEGAVVVIQPSTGKVLAMVSKPDYNPNTIQQDWDALNDENSNSPLFNRATQGLYPPGSTFKVVTALAYMRQNSNYEDFGYQCDGSISVGDVTVRCFNGSVHGHQNLKTALANSCNTSFANIGLDLNNAQFRELCDSLLFNDELPLDYSYSKSEFVLDASSSSGEEMQTAIGQGNTRVTPIYMAMLTSAIANDGELMQPYFIDKIINREDEIVEETDPVSYRNLLSAAEAEVLTEYMEEVVNSGSASALSGQSYRVAGKTGSAEFTDESTDSHAWFIGYSSKDGQADLAISVIAAGAGSGREAAVPIAKRIFDAYY